MKCDLPNVLKWGYHDCSGTNDVERFVGEMMKLKNEFFLNSDEANELNIMSDS